MARQTNQLSSNQLRCVPSLLGTMDEQSSLHGLTESTSKSASTSVELSADSSNERYIASSTGTGCLSCYCCDKAHVGRNICAHASCICSGKRGRVKAKYMHQACHHFHSDPDTLHPTSSGHKATVMASKDSNHHDEKKEPAAYATVKPVPYVKGVPRVSTLTSAISNHSFTDIGNCTVLWIH